MGSSSSPIISPGKLRSDLYSFSTQDDHDPNTPLVISVLASLLERTMSRNERSTKKFINSSPSSPSNDRTHIFYCDRTLDMTIQSFLERIFRYTHIAPSIYVVAYTYIDRFCQIHKEFRITNTNVHRFLITTIMVASKFVEDMNYRNSYFAKVGGITTKEMNKLEVEFLFLMGFKLHVNVKVFESYCCHLEREVSIGGGYQIERSLGFMCGGHMKSIKRENNQRNNLMITTSSNVVHSK
ncbi:hypothetical protein C5167_032263 [Papaver somniferum]|uniref:Cyclin n=1 Tax=Papaver somniferum TaxID=3469 RepID=A0A4Y7KB75_PAPSO|nr:cyclin-U2-1-like [Papaver somniferum]RZC69199.1 hypothetical protein C5167_032263 [Papaver somniferum]